jgi:hypothetical protein
MSKDERIRRDDERRAERERAREAARRIDGIMRERATQSDRAFGADLERKLRDQDATKQLARPARSEHAQRS